MLEANPPRHPNRSKCDRFGRPQRPNHFMWGFPARAARLEDRSPRLQGVCLCEAFKGGLLYGLLQPQPQQATRKGPKVSPFVFTDVGLLLFPLKDISRRSLLACRRRRCAAALLGGAPPPLLKTYCCCCCLLLLIQSTSSLSPQNPHSHTLSHLHSRTLSID